MVNVHSSRSRDLGSSPCQGPCVVFLNKAVYSPVLVPLFTQVYKWVLANLMLGLNPQEMRIPSRVRRSIPTRFMLHGN